MKNLARIFAAILVFALLGAGVWYAANVPHVTSETGSADFKVVPSTTLGTTTTTPTVPTQEFVSSPLTDAYGRITKKPFGLHVDPTHSPVSPEKFTGYHTGVDFETTPEEQDADVPVSAICAGKLLVKKTATGYGGVAVQACTIAGRAVTVIYGHIKLTSVTAKVGTLLEAGQQFAVLGKGYSSETDGERKHLHLGIHEGTSITILGYVQRETDLGAWIDVSNYLHSWY